MLTFSSLLNATRWIAPRRWIGLCGLVLIVASLAGLAAAEPADPGRPVVGKIRGTIRDRANRPIPGLLVQLGARDETGVLRITGTDEKGRYLFRDLPGGIYDVRITVDGYGDQTKGSIEVRPPFQNIVDFLLASGDATPAADADRSTGDPAGAGNESEAGSAVAVRGRLVDENRHPVMEVSVTLVSLEGKETYQAFSDTDGRFVLPSVPPGRYRAVITSPGHVTLDLKSVRVPAESGLDLSLSLVDYPLNFRDGNNSLLPPEKPRPVPLGASAGSGSPS